MYRSLPAFSSMFLHQAWGGIVASLLGPLLITGGILAATQSLDQSPTSVDDVFFIAFIMQTAMSLILVVWVSDRVDRTFTLPVSTSELTDVHLMIGGVAAFLLNALGLLLMSWLFGGSWPIFWPSMLGIIGTVWALAVRFSFRESPVLQIVSLVVASVTASGIIASRVRWEKAAAEGGPEFRAMGSQEWPFLLLTFAAIGLAVAMTRWGLGLGRCGNSPGRFPRLEEWLESFSRPPERVLHSMSSQRRVSWLLRQQAERPLILAVVLLTGSLFVAMFGAMCFRMAKYPGQTGMDGIAGLPYGFVAFLLGGMFFYSLAAGLVMSQTMRRGSELGELGSILGAVPATDSDIAFGSLRATTRTVLTTMGIAVVSGFGIYLLCGAVAGFGRVHKVSNRLAGFFEQPGWEIFPFQLQFVLAILYIAALWTVLSLTATIVLTGRTSVFVSCILIFAAFGISRNVAETALRQAHLLEEVDLAIQIFCIAISVGIIGLFAVALRRQLISMKTARTCLLLAVVLGLLAATHLDFVRTLPQLAAVAATGLWPIAAIAAAPLAVQWNRHR